MGFLICILFTYHVDCELDLVDEEVLPLLDGRHAALDVTQEGRHLPLLPAASVRKEILVLTRVVKGSIRLTFQKYF